MAIKISGNTIINDSRVVENADRIGIGTTNPYVALEVSSGDVGIGTTNPTASNIKTSLQNNTNVLAVGIVTANEYYGLFKGTIDPGSLGNIIVQGNTSAEVVDTGTDGHFLVKTEGTERLRIVADGRIGINSSTPGTGPGGSATGHGDYELDVVKRASSEDAEIRLYNYATGSNNGTVMRFQIAGTSSANHIYFGDGQDSNAGQIVYAHGDDSMRFFVNSPSPDASAGERLRITSDGYVGINNDNPTSMLDIQGDARIRQVGSVNTQNVNLYLGMSNSNDNQGKTAIIAKPIGSWGRHDLHFCLDNVADLNNVLESDSKFVITNVGHVGIGTTNPVAFNINTSLDTNTKVLAVGIVTANEYYGTFKGDIDPGTAITNASKINIQTNSDDGTKYLTFVSGTSGYNDVLVNTNISYNPNFEGRNIGKLTIDGDVGIAGTLTVEDVTNVDSIGLITARTGVRITNNGLIVTAGVSTFGDHLIPSATNSYNIGEDPDVAGNKRWNKVYAAEYYGTFKGTIDPTVSDSKIKQGDTKAEVVDNGTDGHFLVETEGEERLRVTKSGTLELRKDSPQIQLIDTDDVSENTKTQLIHDSGIFYVDLRNGSNDGQLIIRGKGGDTPTERLRIVSDGKIGIGTEVPTDPIGSQNNTKLAVAGIVTAFEYYGLFKGTIDTDVNSISLNTNLEDVFSVSGNQLSGDDAGADKIVFWDDDTGESGGKLTYLSVDINTLEIDDTTLKVKSSAVGKTYTLEAVDSVNNAILRLSDGTTNDDVTITAGSNITIDPVGADGFTIAAVQGAGLDLDSSVADVFDITSGTLSADDPDDDRIIFYDDSTSKLTHLDVGTGLVINDTTLNIDNTVVGKSYTLPASGTDGSGGASGGSGSATLTLTGTDSTTDPVTVTAGSGIVIDNIAESGFRISADISEGGGGGVSDVEVKQFADNASPRSLRVSPLGDPIDVQRSVGIVTIGIGTTSNAYGNRFIQPSTPIGAVEGDIWFDTSTTGSGVNRVAILEDRKNTGNEGGNVGTVNVWFTRTLNHKTDPQNFIISFAGSVFVLEAGTYKIKFSAPGFWCKHYQARMTYSTAADFSVSPNYIQGSSEFSGGTPTVGENIQSRSRGEGVITLTDTTYFKLEQNVSYQQGVSDNNNVNYTTLGVPAYKTGGEVYSQVMIEDLATAIQLENPNRIIQGDTKAEVLDTGTDGRFIVTTNGTERVVVDPNGYLLAKSDIRVRREGGAGGTQNNGAIYFGDSNNNYVFGEDKVEVLTFNSGGSDNFIVGEQVTDTSGDTAYVKTWNSSTYQLTIHDRSGSFQDGETVTGQTSGASWVIASGGLTSSGSNLLSFGTNGSEKLRITDNGSVNIGGDYTQTTHKVQITGDVKINGTLTYEDVSNIDSVGVITCTGLDVNGDANVRDVLLVGGLESQSTQDTSKLAVQGGGSNIGIIQVHAGSGENDGDLSGVTFSHGINNTTARAKAAIAFRCDASGYGRGDLCFYVNNALNNNQVAASDERLRITQAGNLQAAGITTSNTGFMFGTNGEMYLYKSAANTATLRVTSDGPYADFEDVDGDLQMGSASGTLRLSAGGNEKLRIGTSGQIGLGGANYGSAGQVLVSGGPNAAAVWGSGGSGANVSIDVSPPSSANAGDLWWDSDDGDLHVYYDDSSGSPSAQWVAVSSNNPNTTDRAKAWVNFNGKFGVSPFTTSNGGIRAAFNVSSVTDNGIGQYTVNLANNMSDTNYVVSGAAGDTSEAFRDVSVYNTMTQGSFKIATTFVGGTLPGQSYFRDPEIVTVVAFGN